MSWVVLKFGGTSVSTVERWETIVARVKKLLAKGERVWVVVSAVSQVTNRLELAIDEALAPQAGESLSDGGGLLNYETPSLSWIKTRHAELARDLGVADLDYGALAKVLAELEVVLSGIHLTQEASPRLRARVIAYGERLSSMMGQLAMAARGLPQTALLQARTMLVSTEHPDQMLADNDRYLEANVDPRRDETVLAGLAPEATVVITQGFVARNPAGDPCLLGRGGSDTSGALFAALIGAKRLEIWTDVHGLFTADPRDVPNARLIRRLTFREAQELAAMGAKVLHPRCLVPASWGDIPVEIHNTLDPDNEHACTVISSDQKAGRRSAGGEAQAGAGAAAAAAAEAAAAEAEAAAAAAAAGGAADPISEPACHVMAVSRRKEQVLVSISTFNMWGASGFLSRIFRPFEETGMSVDLIATSQYTVSVTLDHVPGGIDGDGFQRLLARLEALGTVEVRSPCTVVSIVGRCLRRGLPELAKAFALTSGCDVHMLTESSEDLSLSFVCDEAPGLELARSLHALYFPPHRNPGSAPPSPARVGLAGAGGDEKAGSSPNGGGGSRAGDSPFFGPTWEGLALPLRNSQQQQQAAAAAADAKAGAEKTSGKETKTGLTTATTTTTKTAAEGEGGGGGDSILHMAKVKSVDGMGSLSI